VLALALAALLAWRLRPADGALRAVVESGGEVVAVLPLAEDAEWLAGDRTGGYNLVRVEDGAVFVAEADCPDLVCVRTGRIDAPDELIACLPHRLIVYVERGGA